MTDLGFNPVQEGERYFISYKTEDSDCVGAITRHLNRLGVPMWYDYGIGPGRIWRKEINENIVKSQAVIVFVTRELFRHGDTFVQKELRIAQRCKNPDKKEKTIYPVWLDDIDPDPIYGDVPVGLVDLYDDLEVRQGLHMEHAAPEEIAKNMINVFSLISGKTPQPPTPTFLQDSRVDRGEKAQLVKTLSYLSNLQRGSTLEFGHYPQGENGEVEPLLWRVLEVDEKRRRALLITEKLIEVRPYHDEYEEVTWEKCTLRRWLNDEFIKRAFNKDEQSRIIEVDIQNPDNPRYGTEGGRATRDRVFLLSIEEAMREDFFEGNSDRRSAPTQYAAKGRLTQMGGWWLRSQGFDDTYAKFVYGELGFVDDYGYDVRKLFGVRPAFWLHL